MTRPRHQLQHLGQHQNRQEMVLEPSSRTVNLNGNGIRTHRVWEYRNNNNNHRLRHHLVRRRIVGNVAPVQEVVKTSPGVVVRVLGVFHRVLDMLKGMQTVKMALLMVLLHHRLNNVSAIDFWSLSE